MPRRHLRQRAGHALGALAFSPTDDSPQAQRWRADPDLHVAWSIFGSAAWGSNSLYKHSDRRVMLTPGQENHSISLSELALAFEVGLGPLSIRRSIDAGIGISWYGVYTQQSVTDSATLHELLWAVQPALMIEIGTFCGGSAIFFARTMMGYNPHARVLTIDRTSSASRRAACRSAGWAKNHGLSGFESNHWSELVKSRHIVPIVGQPDSPALVNRLAKEVASAGGAVFVCDDSDHLAGPVLAHFAALSRFVSPGGFYIVQDTRLDADCAYAMITSRLATDHWCRSVLRNGGAAAAVANITRSPSFARDWVQDRSVEKWVVTQHPGGYLRRRKEPTAAEPATPTPSN